jgi:hypothetical protein
MSVADNDAGAKDGEASKTDAAHGVFLHAHDADSVENKVIVMSSLEAPCFKLSLR